MSSSGSSSNAVKKVGSQVNIDEKTGKVVSTSRTDLSSPDFETINDTPQKVMSNSLPDLQSSPTTSTVSSNSNNQIGHGKHVILAVEAQFSDDLNQINGGGESGEQQVKKKIILNIDPTSNGSSSSTSSNNLEYGNGSSSTTSTL